MTQEFIFFVPLDMGTDGYADDICFKDKVTGDDVMNELTIAACFF